MALGFFGGAGGEFCGENDIVSAGGHELADAGFALAVGVGVCGIDVSDSGVEGEGEGGEGLVIVLVHFEAATCAEAEDGDLDAGAAEYAGGEFFWGSISERMGSNERGCDGGEESPAVHGLDGGGGG